MKPGLDKAELSTTTRPNQDLFRHVNGSWLDSTKIPEDRAVFGSFHMLADDSELAVKEILEDAANNPLPGVSQQIGDLYASFLDEERIEKLGATPLLADLEKIAAVSDLGQLHRLMGYLERMGVGGLWGSYIDNDPGNPERYLVHFYNGGLGLPDKDYYTDEKYQDVRDEYPKHIARMLVLAGWDKAEADSKASQILELESMIASKHWSRVESRDAEKTYNPKTFAELKALTPSILWDEYLSGLGLTDSFLERNVVMMPSFFEGMSDVLVPENLEALKTWLSWVYIRAQAPYLSGDFVAERFSFYGTKLTGQPVNRLRWKRAVSLVEGSLGEAVGQIYVNKHFPASSKSQMDTLVAHLIEAYRQSIDKLDWMTTQPRERLRKSCRSSPPRLVTRLSGTTTRASLFLAKTCCRTFKTFPRGSLILRSRKLVRLLIVMNGT